MSFSAAWLTLREPADHVARSERLVHVIAGALPPGETRVLDLGCGTGSNLRYLGPRLPSPQDWLLVDIDPALLAHIVLQGLEGTGEDGAAPKPEELSCRCVDLSRFDGSLFEGRTLVTASALLDLVSDEWMRSLAAHCRGANAAVLFALTYDGRVEYSPAEPADQRLRDLVNGHQEGNKGFGPALGPRAVEAAARHLADQGYTVQRERSDWVLGADQWQLQRELLEGSARAAMEVAPLESPAIRDWLARRLGHIARGTSRIVVGHEDLAAIPGSAHRR